MNTWTAESIQEYRESLGLSRRAFVRVLRIPYSSLWRWENGRSAPDRRHQERLDAFKRKQAGCTCVVCHGPPVSFSVRSPWTPAEDQIIRAVIQEGGQVEDAQRRIETEHKKTRTRVAVAYRTWELGLSYNNNSIWLSTDEVGRLLGKTRHQVARMIAQGELPARRYISQKVDRQRLWWRIRRDDVEAYRERTRNKAG